MRYGPGASPPPPLQPSLLIKGLSFLVRVGRGKKKGNGPPRTTGMTGSPGFQRRSRKTSGDTDCYIAHGRHLTSICTHRQTLLWPSCQAKPSPPAEQRLASELPGPGLPGRVQPQGAKGAAAASSGSWATDGASCGLQVQDRQTNSNGHGAGQRRSEGGTDYCKRRI